MTAIGRYIESPPFRSVISSGLAANDHDTIDYRTSHDGSAKKYLPFNILTITNFSGQQLEIEINGSIIKRCFESSVIVIELDAIYDVRIKNVASSATDAEIEVIAEKRLTERQLLKLIAQKMGVI